MIRVASPNAPFVSTLSINKPKLTRKATRSSRKIHNQSFVYKMPFPSCFSLIKRWISPSPETMAPQNLAGGRWRELSGASNWEGLLDPPATDLRQYLINYGELTQAIYDAFNDDDKSRFTGAPRYARRDFFDRVFLRAGRPYSYAVTKFLYATAGVELPGGFIVRSLTEDWKLKESNWIGYVAAATDAMKAAAGRREIVVAWRGTVRPLEWVDDFEFKLVPAGDLVAAGAGGDGGGDGKVEVDLGWKSIYTTANPDSPFNKTSVRDQVLQEVRRLVDLYQDEEVSITVAGHSLGSAVATINAIDIVTHGLNKPTGRPNRSAPVTAIVFASPRVGNDAFKKAFDGLAPDLRLLRVTNSPDIVPKYPFVGYSDVGAELVIDSLKSEFLKPDGGPGEWHSLETYLHGVAGGQGSKGGFKLEVERDISLLNKHMDAAKDEYMIPASWWVEKNNGMLQAENGRWSLQDHEEDDDDAWMKELLG